MDPESLVVLVPIAAIAAWDAIKVAKIQAGSRAAGVDPDTAGRLQALEQEVGALRQDMVEAQERLDFAERVFAQDPPTGSIRPSNLDVRRMPSAVRYMRGWPRGGRRGY
jgi:hypothetical protein